MLKEGASYAEHLFVVRLLHLMPEEQEHSRGEHRQQLQETEQLRAPEELHLQPQEPEELHPRQQADLQEQRRVQLQEKERERRLLQEEGQERRQPQEEERDRQAAELRELLREGLLQQGSTELPQHIPEGHHRVP